VGPRLIAQWLLRFIRRRQWERDLADEMQLHLDLRAAREVEQGATPGEALTMARRRFGGTIRLREESREAWGWRWLDDAVRSLRAACRTVRKRPILAAVFVTTLALSIGANVAVFTVMDQVVLHPLAVPDPGALVTVQRTYDLRGVRRQQASVTWDQAETMQAMKDIVVALTSTGNDRVTKGMSVRTSDGVAADVDGRFVSGNYFQVLGIAPDFGPGIGPADDSAGAPPVVVLDYRFWRTRFGADPAVLGRTMWINGTAATVVGVAPESFTGTSLGVDPPAIYLPLMTASRLANDSGSQVDRYGRGAMVVGASGGPASSGFVPSPISPVSSLAFIARLRSGHDLSRVRAQALATLTSPGWNVVPLTATMLPVDAQRDVRQFLMLVAGGVGLTFLIGCTNVAGLLIVRGDERRAELAVRAALGAGRARLVLDLAAEAAVLIATGTIAAVFVARGILACLSTYVLPGNVPVSALPAGLTARAWLVAALSVFVVGVFVALWPALRATRGAIAEDVARRTSARLGGPRLLVALQVATCIVLVFGAALFVRSVSNALSIDVGFDPRGLASAELGISPSVRRDPAATVAQIDALDGLADAARAVPGVSAAAAGPLPLVAPAEGSYDALSIDGAVSPQTPIDVVYASSGYFTALGQRVVAGRDFSDEDRMGSRAAVILNEAAARQSFGDRDPVGREAVLSRSIGGRLTNEPSRLVIGVVRDVRLATLRDSGKPIVYFARTQNKFYLAGYMAGVGGSRLIIRSTRSASDLRAALAGPAAAAGFELRGFTSLRDKVDEILMPQRLGRLVLGSLGVLALTLTVIGVYGLVSHLVARSAREVGIRMALGAGAAQIARDVLLWMLWPLTLGLAVGVVLARLGGHAVDRFMYGVTGADLGVLTLTFVAIIVSVVAATIPPIRRALRVDPIAALRSE
jgi:predicted permease